MIVETVCFPRKSCNNMEWEWGDFGGKMETIRESFTEEVEMLLTNQYSPFNISESWKKSLYV